MYAIVENGGKQYKAVPGTMIEVDLLQAEEGSQFDFDQVLLISNDETVTVGTPVVSGAKVTTTVVEHFKGKKIVVFKYKSGNNYRRKRGHRQQYTRLQVNEILVK